MFNYFRGKLVEKHPTVVVIDIGGIGYTVLIPLSTYSQLPQVHEEVMLYMHLHIREDAWQLFGFASLREKELFKLLITVSGIGPKLGLTILSGIGIENFKRAVINRDSAFLTSISGIGKKTAERIIVELKEKITFDEATETEHAVAVACDIGETLLEDSVTALISLGYKRNEAQKAIKKVVREVGKSDFTVEELIRRSLTYI